VSQTAPLDHEIDEPLASPAAERGLHQRVARELRRAVVDPAIAPERQIGDIVGQPLDRVATFSSVVMAMRLATTAIGILLASQDILAGHTAYIVTTIVVTTYATIRSFRPIRYTGDVISLIAVVAEVALHVAAVDVTGGWSSPFVFSFITAVCIAGFARGYGFALRIGIASALAVSLPTILGPNVTTETVKVCGTWSGMLLLISIVAGYGRRVSGEADRERDLALDRLSRLADANALLYSLHRVAQTLPQSLDMSDVLESTVGRLRGLIDFDALVILLFDDTDGHWAVVRMEGCNLPSRLGPTDLPPGLRNAIAEGGVISMPALGSGNPGFDDRSGSGLYAPLTARGSIMGLIALEHREPSRFDHRAGGLLSGFVPPLSLAMDNARWFARLRTVGADEERTRIARDLHDRIGQSLAYLAFELDRIVTKDQSGERVSQSLERLRNDVRGVIREVRDTLYDLRTDVSEEQSLAEIMDQYAERVRARTSLEFEIDADTDKRLPILQEREMWRIAQEAITNIERHAKATKIRVTWRCDGGRAAIRITDNGVGFEIGRAGRLDSYGMLGMRERASSIGATLDIHSVPGQGTSITCVLDPSADDRSNRGKDKGGEPARATTEPVRTDTHPVRELSQTGGTR
jgi:signal transduction histidine kinase